MNRPLKAVKEIRAVESREGKGELRTSLITERIIVQRLWSFPLIIRCGIERLKLLPKDI